VSAVPKRFLNIHEYQSSALMAEVNKWIPQRNPMVRSGKAKERKRA
jgi:hypothetical protein